MPGRCVVFGEDVDQLDDPVLAVRSLGRHLNREALSRRSIPRHAAGNESGGRIRPCPYDKSMTGDAGRQRDDVAAIRAGWYTDLYRAAWQLRRMIRAHGYNVAPEGEAVFELAQAADIVLLGAPAEIAAVIPDLMVLADEWTTAPTQRSDITPAGARIKAEVEAVFMDLLAQLRTLIRADLGLPATDPPAWTWPPQTQG